jgi:hypothetical protein
MGQQPVHDLPSTNGYNLMLVCDRTDAETIDEDRSRRGWAHGIFVYRKKLEKNCHYVGIVCAAEFQLLDENRDQVRIQCMETVGPSDKILTGVRGLDGGTQWCVD